MSDHFDPVPPIELKWFAEQHGVRDAIDHRWHFTRQLPHRLTCGCTAGSNISPLVEMRRAGTLAPLQLIPEGTSRCFFGQCPLCDRVFWHAELDYRGELLFQRTRVSTAAERDFVERSQHRFIDRPEGGAR